MIPRAGLGRLDLFRAAALAALAALSSAPAAAQPRVFPFGGLTWVARRSAEPQAPGPNRFSDDPAIVGLDAEGRLRLSMRKEGGTWLATELAAREGTGYGRYAIEIEGSIRGLDPGLVFGFFTWDRRPEAHNRELDVEVSRWGDPGGPELWFSVQPYEAPGAQASGRLPPAAAYRFELLWLPGRAEFRAWALGEGPAPEAPGRPAEALPRGVGEAGHPADPPPFLEFVRTEGVPDPGKVRLHLNLWAFRGGPPLLPFGTEGAHEVLVRALSYEPAP